MQNRKVYFRKIFHIGVQHFVLSKALAFVLPKALAFVGSVSWQPRLNISLNSPAHLNQFDTHYHIHVFLKNGEGTSIYT
jgi:diadenosine tetraphosphate (Ap4A) HIT family hydrolase